MKNSKLTTEEQDLLSSVDRGEWRTTPQFAKRKQELSKIAKATLRKEKRLNIRISERDLKELQLKALHEGLPYQTFVSSILHKYVNGSLVEAR